MFESRNMRSQMGCGARSDQDSAGTHSLSARQEAHCLRVFDNCAASRQHDLGAIEGTDIGRFQPGDLPVLVGNEPRPAEDRLVHRPAVPGCILEIVSKTRGVDQQLLGNATADHASSANPVFLGHHDARAVTCGNARRPHAPRSCTDDKKIDLAISHSSDPKRGRGSPLD